MKRKLLLGAAVAALVAGHALMAQAELKPGAAAPDFTTQASLGGKTYTYSLADALKQGPVVLYFYPAAFTKGCTIEAHAFADAVDRYKAYGATVIGVSADKIDRPSLSRCTRGRRAPPAARVAAHHRGRRLAACVRPPDPRAGRRDARRPRDRDRRMARGPQCRRGRFRRPVGPALFGELRWRVAPVPARMAARTRGAGTARMHRENHPRNWRRTGPARQRVIVSSSSCRVL